MWVESHSASRHAMFSVTSGENNLAKPTFPILRAGASRIHTTISLADGNKPTKRGAPLFYFILFALVRKKLA
jgi:hypothetical protein